MKDHWREFWTREPSDTEKRLCEAGFSPTQASQLMDLRLRYEYGQFPDDGGPAPRSNAGNPDQRP